MIIAIMMEGRTEKVFLPVLRRYLENFLMGRMPRLDPVPYDGRIPKGEKLKREVERLLNDSNNPADAVVALTDVYTGTQPPDFNDAAEAKEKMRQWVDNESRFYPHAAQFEFEAWLLPYWDVIQSIAGFTASVPGPNPEDVNHTNPPSHRISKVFRRGKLRCYVKTRDAARILRDIDLGKAVSQCRELKAFVDTIISLCGSE